MGKDDKRGFSLIDLLIVMLILAILAGIVIISVGGVFGTASERAYEEAKDQIQLAVGDYMTRNNGYPPITGDAILIDGINYRIIDICILQMSYNGPDGPGMPLEIPVSCVDTTDDNCDNASCMGNISSDAGSCDPRVHYIWAATPEGNVKSSCVGAVPDECDANNADGYQGIYP